MVQVEAPAFAGKGLLSAIAAACALLAGVLAAVTLGVGWADFAGNGFSITYNSHDLAVEGGGFTATVEYTDEGFDDEPGASQLRAGGPLMVAGVVTVFVGFAMALVSLFVRGAHLNSLSTGVLAIAALVLLAANIVLPLGIDAHASDSDIDIGWGAGLVLASIASAFAIASASLCAAGRR